MIRGIPTRIEDNLTAYLEIARYALKDADIFDEMAEKLDISDREMLHLRDQLESFMGKED